MALTSKTRKLKSLNNQLKRAGSDLQRVNIQKRIDTLNNSK